MRAVATGLVLLCLGHVARADDDASLNEAKRLAARAQEHFDLGEYEAAIRDYRDAYRLVPSPGLLYNLGQAYRLEGDCVAASTMYRNYLRLAPRSRYRMMVKHHLAHLDACVQQRAREDEVLAAVSHTGRASQHAGLAVGGAGILVAGVGTWLALSVPDEPMMIQARGDKEDEEAPAPAMDDGHPLLATALITGGVVAAAAGATLFYFGWRDEHRSSTMLSVLPTAHGAAAQIGWRF